MCSKSKIYMELNRLWSVLCLLCHDAFYVMGDACDKEKDIFEKD